MMRDERRRLVYEVVRRLTRSESIRQIARVLQIDRKTVRRIIKEVHARRAEGDDALTRELPKPRAPRPSKLDPYVDRIKELVEDPTLRGITARRVFEIIGGEGFEGKYSIVRDYMRTTPRAGRPMTPSPPRPESRLSLTGRHSPCLGATST